MLLDRNAAKLKKLMVNFEKTGKLTVGGATLSRAQEDFLSGRSDEESILDCIRTYHKDYNYILCPHSATGVAAINQLKINTSRMVCLATAHPAKFPEAIKKVIMKPETPPTELKKIHYMETRSVSMENSKLEVKKFILNNLQNNGVITLSPEEMKKLTSDDAGIVPRLRSTLSTIFQPSNPLLIFGVIAFSGGILWSLYNARGKNTLKI